MIMLYFSGRVCYDLAGIRPVMTEYLSLIHIYGRQSNIIDYTYTNYDLTAVEADYEKTADELSRAQLALDTVNQRDSFEFCE